MRVSKCHIVAIFVIVNVWKKSHFMFVGVSVSPCISYAQRQDLIWYRYIPKAKYMFRTAVMLFI